MSKRKKHSAGLVMYRRIGEEVEVFLVHPGGPLWANKDEGAWTIPKGEYEADEDPLAAAQREFEEETSFVASGPFVELGSIKQKSGKIVTAWAFAGNCDPEKLVSNTCMIEWPPRSGKQVEIPEIDRGGWFTFKRGKKYVRDEQAALLERLEEFLQPSTGHKPD